MLDLRVNAQSTRHTRHILPYLKKFLLADYAQPFLPRTSLNLDCRVLPYVAGLYLSAPVCVVVLYVLLRFAHTGRGVINSFRRINVV